MRGYGRVPAVGTDTECTDFLDTGAGGGAALNAVLAVGSADKNFQLADDIIPAAGFNGAIGGAYNQVAGAPIVLNWNRIGDTNTYSQYLAILHEIGHLLDPTGYNQNDGMILPDGTSGGAGNDTLIRDNCYKTLNSGSN
jgi:hypothetical protein